MHRIHDDRAQTGRLPRLAAKLLRRFHHGGILLSVALVVLTLRAPASAAQDRKPTIDRAKVTAMLPELRLLEPPWHGDVSHRESVLFVADEEGKPATGTLLFPAAKITAIHSADGAQHFEAGRDFQLADGGRRLLRSEGSRIPQLAAAELFPPAGAPRSIPAMAGDPQRAVLFDNAHWFHDQQVEVTYAHLGHAWQGPVTRRAVRELAGTRARLRDKQPLTLAISGDSISEGYNASGFSDARPGMPPYPDLVAAQLQATCGGEVTLHNRAVGGWSVKRGVKDLDGLLATRPHLVIIAYGMNDVRSRDPDGFRQSIETMLTTIRRADPQTEVILVAPMIGNTRWEPTPREMFAQYRDALAGLVGPGVALADLAAVWDELLKHKREVDLTGNGVNHPNDYGHRLYAQVILALLVEPQAP